MARIYSIVALLPLLSPAGCLLFPGGAGCEEDGGGLHLIIRGEGGLPNDLQLMFEIDGGEGGRLYLDCDVAHSPDCTGGEAFLDDLPPVPGMTVSNVNAPSGRSVVNVTLRGSFVGDAHALGVVAYSDGAELIAEDHAVTYVRPEVPDYCDDDPEPRATLDLEW